MSEIKKIRVEIENPTWRQRVVMAIGNFLLYLIPIVFKGDKKRMEKEIKEVGIEMIKTLKKL